jgi:hypothetical protein
MGLNARRSPPANEARRAELLLTVKDGKLYNAEGKLFDTSEVSTLWSGPNRAIYVMDQNGNFYASEQIGGKIHHSSILAGKPVAGAGEIQVSKGELQYINRGSRHYEPAPECCNKRSTNLERKACALEIG